MRAGDIATRLTSSRRHAGDPSRLGRFARRAPSDRGARARSGVRLLGGYMWWVRDWGSSRSSTSRSAASTGRRHLRSGARCARPGARMTTLHVREDELERAVDSFATVRSLSASADFPKTLASWSNEYEPVAALVGSRWPSRRWLAGATVLRAVSSQTGRCRSSRLARSPPRLRRGMPRRSAWSTSSPRRRGAPPADRARLHDRARAAIATAQRPGPVLRLCQPARGQVGGGRPRAGRRGLGRRAVHRRAPARAPGGGRLRPRRRLTGPPAGAG